MQETSERLVEKSVTVSVPIERAFEVFTAEIGTWWPLRTHAVDTEHSETVVMEARVGGRLFECTLSGKEHVWGTIAAWAWGLQRLVDYVTTRDVFDHGRIIAFGH